MNKNLIIAKQLLVIAKELAEEENQAEAAGLGTKIGMGLISLMSLFGGPKDAQATPGRHGSKAPISREYKDPEIEKAEKNMMAIMPKVAKILEYNFPGEFSELSSPAAQRQIVRAIMNDPIPDSGAYLRVKSRFEGTGRTMKGEGGSIVFDREGGQPQLALPKKLDPDSPILVVIVNLVERRHNSAK